MKQEYNGYEDEKVSSVTLRRESVASTDEPRTETLLISDQENRNLHDPRKRLKVSFIFSLAIIRYQIKSSYKKTF